MSKSTLTSYALQIVFFIVVAISIITVAGYVDRLHNVL